MTTEEKLADAIAGLRLAHNTIMSFAKLFDKLLLPFDADPVISEHRRAVKEAAQIADANITRRLAGLSEN